MIATQGVGDDHGHAARRVDRPEGRAGVGGLDHRRTSVAVPDGRRTPEPDVTVLIRANGQGESGGAAGERSEIDAERLPAIAGSDRALADDGFDTRARRLDSEDDRVVVGGADGEIEPRPFAELLMPREPLRSTRDQGLAEDAVESVPPDPGRHPCEVLGPGDDAGGFEGEVGAVGIDEAASLLVAIRLEERDLVAEHGESYTSYRDRVPALVPFSGGGLRTADDARQAA